MPSGHPSWPHSQQITDARGEVERHSWDDPPTFISMAQSLGYIRLWKCEISPNLETLQSISQSITIPFYHCRGRRPCWRQYRQYRHHIPPHLQRWHPDLGIYTPSRTCNAPLPASADQRCYPSSGPNHVCTRPIHHIPRYRNVLTCPNSSLTIRRYRRRSSVANGGKRHPSPRSSVFANMWSGRGNLHSRSTGHPRTQAGLLDIERPPSPWSRPIMGSYGRIKIYKSKITNILWFWTPDFNLHAYL